MSDVVHLVSKWGGYPEDEEKCCSRNFIINRNYAYCSYDNYKDKSLEE